MVGGDYQVRGQGQLESAPERQAVDRGDDGLADVEELGDAGEPAGPVIRLDRLSRRSGLQVPAGAEEAVTCPGQDPGAQLRIPPQPVESLVQRPAGDYVDRVGLGPVQGDYQHLA